MLQARFAVSCRTNGLLLGILLPLPSIDVYAFAVGSLIPASTNKFICLWNSIEEGSHFNRESSS